jgi:Outer membrane protein beta-barrel domain
MKFLVINVLTICLVGFSALAQPRQPLLEFGVKAGGTFTNGHTSVATQDLGPNGKVPELTNKANGIGTGYTGGLWVRRNFDGFFLQTEATYNRFVLNQKTNTTTLDVKAVGALAGDLVPAAFASILQSLPLGTLSATLDINSVSNLESVNVPILVGKQFANNRFRVYAGPSFWFVRKAEINRDVTGQVNAAPAVSPLLANPYPLTSTGTTDLLNPDIAGTLAIKTFTYALDIGAGLTVFRRFDVDVRLTGPVGGVYKSKDIKGFGGSAIVTLGYRILGE